MPSFGIDTLFDLILRRIAPARDVDMLECRQDLSDSHALVEAWVEEQREESDK
jgi:hypothetical protein